MIQRELENDMKKFVGGGSFISPGELTRYLGQKNTSRIREQFMDGAFRIEGTKKYFIPEVARNIYQSGQW